MEGADVLVKFTIVEQTIIKFEDFKWSTAFQFYLDCPGTMGELFCAVHRRKIDGHATGINEVIINVGNRQRVKTRLRVDELSQEWVLCGPDIDFGGHVGKAGRLIVKDGKLYAELDVGDAPKLFGTVMDIQAP